MSELTLTSTKLPSHINTDSGRGNEEVTANALTIPRIKQLQKMSDECDKHHPKYIKGSDDGVFLNGLTNELLGTELYLINIKFKDEYVVWKKREKGGGLVGSFKTNKEALDAQQDQDNPDDYDVKPTHTHLLLIKNPETGELSSPVLMDFASSKLKPSRDWNPQINLKGGDRFAGLWKMSSVPVSNGGNNWMNIDITFEGWTVKEDYETAEQLFLQFENTEL